MWAARMRAGIATKSDLVLRDLDLIKTFPDVNTLDESFKNDMDNGKPMPQKIGWIM